jgi:hypothetical protein
MVAVKEWMMRLQEAENESLAVVMNNLHQSGALWAPRLNESIPEIGMNKSLFPEPAYV